MTSQSPNFFLKRSPLYNERKILFGMDLIVLLILPVLLYLTFSFFQRPPNFPPGPFWFPIVGNLPLVHILHQKLGYYHLVWGKLAEEYGPLVGLKLGRDSVVLCSGHEAVKCVYGKEELDGRSDGFFFRLRTYGERLGVAFTDGELWTRTRTFVMKTLRELGSGKERMEEMISEEATDLAKLIEKNCQNEHGEYRPKDLSALFRLSILNSQWAFISGQRFDLGDKKLVDLQQLVAGFFKSNDLSGGLVSQIPWIRFIAPELSGYNTMAALVKPLQKFCEDLVEEHAQRIDYDADEQYSLIDKYLVQIKKVNHPDPVFNKKQLTCVVMDLFMAGPETVSTVMAFILQFLVLYPRSQEKIREEIDAVIGTSSSVSMSNLEKMPFTKAFIAESHRFSGMVPISIPHRAMTDVELYSYTIPKGTILLLSNYSVHMDKKHWGDPEVFRPERFLDKTGQYFIQDNWVIPYGLGRRRCLGENIAKDTIFIFLVTILQRFVISIPEGEVIDIKPTEGLTMSPKEFSGIVKLRA